MDNPLLREYLPILVLLAFAVGLGLVLILAAAVIAVRNPDPEKVSAYECGFEAFDEARKQFDVRFYLVAILFIIFDLEVAFLFPWAVALGAVGMFGFWSMMIFLGVLTIAVLVVWKKLPWPAVRAIPGPLVAVVVGTAVSLVAKMDVKRVDLPETLAFTQLKLPTEWGAFLVAVLALVAAVSGVNRAMLTLLFLFAIAFQGRCSHCVN